MDLSSDVKATGDIQLIIDYKDNCSQEIIEFPNSVLKIGRRALALTLANQLGGDFSFYITRMIFGDGGTFDGIKKYVNADRTGLFGVTRISKPVLSNIDSNIPTQVIFTSVIKFEEGIGVVLNEMALQMSNGDLYSMSTFPDLTKTEEMQLTLNWKLNFV